MRQLAAVALITVFAMPACDSVRNDKIVRWDSPTGEPCFNQKGQPIIGGGMPIGNGETALLVFPLVPQQWAPSPPPPPPPCPRANLLGGKYCYLGHFIGCKKDDSCHIDGDKICFSTSETDCAMEAAQLCNQTAACVAFDVGQTIDGWIFRMIRNNLRVLHGVSDPSWTYYVSSEPWPQPPKFVGGAGAIPAQLVDGTYQQFESTAPPKLGGFQLPNSVSFFVNMATAMASDTSLFKLGMVSLITDPPLFDPTETLSNFSQSLDMLTATVHISATTQKGREVRVSVWVDANANHITARLYSSVPVSLRVLVQSVHPDQRFTYDGGFMGPPHFPSPESGPDQISPLFTPKGRVTISHRNEDTDVPAAFNYTLRQQGLGKLTNFLQGSDRWRHRQFGMLLSGSIQGGKALVRTSPATLESTESATEFEVTATTASEQTLTSDKWHSSLNSYHSKATGGEPHDPVLRSHAVQSRECDHLGWWSKFWNRSYIDVSSPHVNESADVELLTDQYAITRYVQAIQSQTWVPIKFNGQMFTANLPPETNVSGPTARDWGANSWWQNTRLPYWTMAAAADFDTLSTIFEFYLQTLDFAAARTIAYFNHTGIFYTETKTLFGAYAVEDYADSPLGNSSARGGEGQLPIYLENNSYVHYDRGGNAGGPEVTMLILDHWLYSRNRTALQRYFPIVEGTLEFFGNHYKNRTADDKIMIFPTQALETYWCASWTNGSWQAPYFDAQKNQSNCIVNDHPTVAALHTIFERALAELPTDMVTAEQRTFWQNTLDALPEVPLIVENGIWSTSPYGSYPINNKLHNSETPELYSVHPFRYFTLGRNLSGPIRDFTPALNCLIHGSKVRRTCGNGNGNGGWNQGIMNAALMGDAAIAKMQCINRARTPAGRGYRFQGFAPHEQDYEPSADQFANMNSALNWMILQPADDAEGRTIAFGAWPCEWDVEFKLAAPHNTTVEGAMKNGKVHKLIVTPESRRKTILVQPCQSVDHICEIHNYSAICRHIKPGEKATMTKQQCSSKCQPPPKRYACNHIMGRCELVPPNKPGQPESECALNCTQTKYKCYNDTGQCRPVQDGHAGQTLSVCKASCEEVDLYACNSTKGQCERTKKGRSGLSKDNCIANCTMQLYVCHTETEQCIESFHGHRGQSLPDCRQHCKSTPLFQCNITSGLCDPVSFGTNGTTRSKCMDNCSSS